MAGRCEDAGIPMNDSLIPNPPEHYETVLRESRAIGFGMPSDAPTGALLRVLAASKPGGAFLELGTGTGLAAAWLLDGMDAASTLVSVEVNEAFQNIARTALGHDTRLRLILADALSFLENHAGAAFDLIYADAIPGKYAGFSHTLRLLRPGGILVLDDMLPQPNWPKDHPPKVESLLRTLDALPSRTFSVTKLCWGTGHVLVARR